MVMGDKFVHMQLVNNNNKNNFIPCMPRELNSYAPHIAGKLVVAGRDSFKTFS